MITSAPEVRTIARIVSRRDVADDVVEIELRRDDGQQWPEWTPGAHIDLELPTGDVRQYSLVGSLHDRGVLTVAVLRDEGGRGGSAWIHDHARESTYLKVRGPRNHFSLCASSAYTFVAAGIGITPLLPMIESAEAVGADWQLIYCGRNRSSMSYLPELEKYGQRVVVQPRDECDRVDFVEVLSNAVDPDAVYVCGPESFIVGAEQAAEQISAPAPKVERFVPKTYDDAVDTAFEVELASDGRVMDIPADRSILEVLTENGVNVIASCQEGTCGTCETGVVSGTPDHRDSVLTQAEQDENEYMMVCCSRSKCARLVLDL